MDDGARETGGSGPARDRMRGGHARLGRRSSYAPVHGGAEHRSGDQGGATYAALDLGTNNCRLLIARPTSDGFRVVDAFSRIIRLGEGISSSGRIGDPAILRAIDALTICRDKMRNRGVTRARLIATEACRAAENGDAFQARVRESIGLDLEIIDRETEAALAAAGCTPLIDPQSRGVVLFDIGGGSSELVRLGCSAPVLRGPPRPSIQSWVSLPVGVVTLAERHGGVTVTAGVFRNMVDEVTRYLADFVDAHGGDLEGVHLLGTSGTVTTIAGVHLDLPRYDRRRIDGCWLSEADISSVFDRLIGMGYEERVASPCIGSERADLVLAGCAILEAIRRAFPCPRLRVADRGLREGILVDLMRADGAWGAET